MSKFRAVKVDTMEKLEKAVKDNAAVIMLTNKNISKKVKEISDHDVKAQKKSDKLLKAGGISALTGAGLFVAGLLASEALIPAFAIGLTLSLLTSAGTLSAGSIKKILNAISTELKDYKWYEIKGKNEILVLYKYRGNNTFNPDVDELEV